MVQCLPNWTPTVLLLLLVLSSFTYKAQPLVEKETSETLNLEIRDTLTLIEKAIQLTDYPDHGKSVTFVLGNPGNGMSTLVNILINNEKLVAEEIPPNSKIFIVKDLQQNGTEIDLTNHFYPKLLEDLGTKAIFYDCPGFGNPINAANDIAAMFSLHKAAVNVKEVKIIFAITFAAVEKDKSPLEFFRLLKHASEFISDIETFHDSCLLVVTKVRNRFTKQGNLIDDETVITSIQNFMENFQDTLENHELLTPNEIVRFKKLIQIFLSHIILSRNPDKNGILVNNKYVKQSRSGILEHLNALAFAPTTKNTFSYTLSDRSKNFVEVMLDAIVFASQKMLRIFFNQWQKQLVSQVEKEFARETEYVFENHSLALASVFNETSEVFQLSGLFPAKLLAAIDNLTDISLDKELVIRTVQYGKYLKMFETVSQREAQGLNLEGMEILKFVKYAKKYRDWYGFLCAIIDDFRSFEGAEKQKKLLIDNPDLLGVTTENFPVLFASVKAKNEWVNKFDTVGLYNLTKKQVSEFQIVILPVKVTCLTSGDSNIVNGTSIYIKDVARFCATQQPAVLLFATENVVISSENKFDVDLLVIISPKIEVVKESSIILNDGDDKKEKTLGGSIVLISGFIENAEELLLVSSSSKFPGVIKVIDLTDQSSPNFMQPFKNTIAINGSETDLSNLYQFLVSYAYIVLPVLTSLTDQSVGKFYNSLSENKDVIDISGCLGLMQEVIAFSENLEGNALKVNRFVLPLLQSEKRKIAWYSNVMFYNTSATMYCYDSDNICETPFTNLELEQSPSNQKALAFAYTAVLAQCSVFVEYTRDHISYSILSLFKMVKEILQTANSPLVLRSSLDSMLKHADELKTDALHKTLQALHILSGTTKEVMENYSEALEKKLKGYDKVLNSKKNEIEKSEARFKLEKAFVESCLFETFRVTTGSLAVLFSTKTIFTIALKSETTVDWAYLSNSSLKKMQLDSTINQGDIKESAESLSHWFFTHNRNQMRIINNEMNRLKTYIQTLSDIDTSEITNLIEEHQALKNDQTADFIELSNVRLKITESISKFANNSKASQSLLQPLLASSAIIQIADTSFYFSKYVAKDSKVGEIGEILLKANSELQLLVEIKKQIYSYVYRIYNSLINLQNKEDIDTENLLGKVEKLSSFVTNLRNQLAKVKSNFSERILKFYNILDSSLLSLSSNAKEIDIYVLNSELLRHFELLNDPQVSKFEIEGSEMLSTTTQLENIIATATFQWIYNIAFTVFRQQIFPLVGPHIADLTVPRYISNNTSALQSLLKQNFHKIIGILKSVQKSVVAGNDTYFRFQSFSNKNGVRGLPFYTWKAEDLQTEISKLLHGERIVLHSNIFSSPPGMDVIKFTKVRLMLKPKNHLILKEFNEKLSLFNVVMNHSGISYYRCREKFYTMKSPITEILFSVKHKGNNPVVWNNAYKLIENGEIVLSPYSTWTIKLEVPARVGTVRDFSSLYKFEKEQIDIFLEGSGMFLDSETDLSPFNIDQYYEHDKVLLEMSNLKPALLFQNIKINTIDELIL